MRMNFYFYLVVILALGAVTMMPFPSAAQDIFLKNDRGSKTSSGSEGGGKKLYLTPKPGDLGKTRYRSSQQRTTYNTPGRNQPRRTGPNPALNRNNELDRVQQANIDGAQARAARNAEIVRQMQKKWDAERAVASQEFRKKRMAERAMEEQKGAATSGEGSGRDLTNARFLEKTGKGVKAPARTFNIFR